MYTLVPWRGKTLLSPAPTLLPFPPAAATPEGYSLDLRNFSTLDGEIQRTQNVSDHIKTRRFYVLTVFLW